MDMTHAFRPPSGLLHPLSLLSFVPLFFGSLYHAGGQNLTRSTIDSFFFFICTPFDRMFVMPASSIAPKGASGISPGHWHHYPQYNPAKSREW
ncbi:hypothetical protein CCUS01_11680 [Colletotrichum cuscutae]|uniref:Uncharacterized protein n=1 Tax=Colletotrichum cuscutae TaxID=1209917 RepID=A0AAI9TYX1_9PEZI|nr:hypothetical protein CCUS01_11680 [Colletotrichum cuscutae]